MFDHRQRQPRSAGKRGSNDGHAYADPDSSSHADSDSSGRADTDSHAYADSNSGGHADSDSYTDDNGRASVGARPARQRSGGLGWFVRPG